MFKRRKRTPSDRRRWAKPLSAIVAGVGAVAGSLLFWRKRKAS